MVAAPGYEAFAGPRDACSEHVPGRDARSVTYSTARDEATTTVVFFSHGMERNRSQGHFVRP